MSVFSIRPERAAEFPAIYDLVKVAFQTARVSSGDEQDYVDRLRAGENYLPDLALVAELDGRLAGHVMLTRAPLRTDDGRAVRTLLLAPLSVPLADRSRGFGAALSREAFRRAREGGWQAVFLVGNPEYYGRLGFRAASEYGIVFTGEVPPQFVLALELEKGALSGGEIAIAEH